MSCIEICAGEEEDRNQLHAFSLSATNMRVRWTFFDSLFCTSIFVHCDVVYFML